MRRSRRITSVSRGVGAGGGSHPAPPAPPPSVFEFESGDENLWRGGRGGYIRCLSGDSRTKPNEYLEQSRMDRLKNARGFQRFFSVSETEKIE